MEEFPVIFIYKNEKTALTKVIRKEWVFCLTATLLVVNFSWKTILKTNPPAKPPLNSPIIYWTKRKHVWTGSPRENGTQGINFVKQKRKREESDNVNERRHFFNFSLCLLEDRYFKTHLLTFCCKRSSGPQLNCKVQCQGVTFWEHLVSLSSWFEVWLAFGPL